MEIASAMHRALAGRVTQERFAVWFGRGVRMEPCGKTLRIAAADTFRLDYLRRVFRADLIEAVRMVSRSLPDVELETVEFVLDSAVIFDGPASQPSGPQGSSLAQEAATMDHSPGENSSVGERRERDVIKAATRHQAPPI